MQVVLLIGSMLFVGVSTILSPQSQLQGLAINPVPQGRFVSTILSPQSQLQGKFHSVKKQENRKVSTILSPQSQLQAYILAY